ncbi:hypothetical protein EMIT0P253_190037 [Pseudomonas sp. IT-P253]
MIRKKTKKPPEPVAFFMLHLAGIRSIERSKDCSLRQLLQGMHSNVGVAAGEACVRLRSSRKT